MNRVAEDIITSTSSWTAPAGVTSVMLTPLNGSNVPLTSSSLISVTPAMTYTVTIIGSNYNLNSPNTFGSLYSWTGAARLKVGWVE